MKFQCQLCGHLDAEAPRVCPRCSLKAGADQRGRPMTPIDLAVWWALQLWFGAWR